VHIPKDGRISDPDLWDRRAKGGSGDSRDTESSAGVDMSRFERDREGRVNVMQGRHAGTSADSSVEGGVKRRECTKPDVREKE